MLFGDRDYVVFMFTFHKSGVVSGTLQEVNKNLIEAYILLTTLIIPKRFTRYFRP